MMLQQMMMMDPAMMMLFGGMGMGMGNPFGGFPLLDMQRMMQMESMMGGLGGMDPYMMSMMMQ